MSSAQGSAVANRIAATGFACSVGCLLVFVLSIAAETLVPVALSGIMWAVGPGLSIAALARRRGPSRGGRRLAIAGIVISAAAVVVLILLIVALISALDAFT